MSSVNALQNSCSSWRAPSDYSILASVRFAFYTAFNLSVSAGCCLQLALACTTIVAAVAIVAAAVIAHCL